MAWIESNQTLGRHPKTKKLARLLGCNIPQAVGHLHFLWWWALDYAEDGNLDKYDHEDIADAGLWEGDPNTFIASLIDAGFVDLDMTLHDWYDYAGKLLARRESNARRMKEARAKNVQRTCNARATHVQNTCVATVPNRTVPNSTINTLTSELPKPGSPNKQFDETHDAMKLAKHLKGCILARDSSTKTPASLQAWAKDADRMMRLDKRDFQEAWNLIEWCQQDDFWSTNILSMGTFRKQYDQLKRKSQHAQGQKSHERTLEDVLKDLRMEGG